MEIEEELREKAILVEALKCLICHQPQHKPNNFLCSHSFCKECLDDLAKFNDNGSAIIKCPFQCGDAFIKQNETTTSLTSYYSLQSVLEKINISQDNTEAENEEAWTAEYNAGEDFAITGGEKYMQAMELQQKENAFKLAQYNLNSAATVSQQQQQQQQLQQQQQKQQRNLPLFLQENQQILQPLHLQLPTSSSAARTSATPSDFLGDLIEEVKQYRCLWDSSCRGFKELPKKQESWKRVATKLCTNAKDAQAQWTKLKENYRKCLKRRESATRSGAGAKTLPTCQYFGELAFITDTVTNRSTVSNISIFTPPPSPRSQCLISPPAPEASVSSGSDDITTTQFQNTTSTTNSNSTISKKRKGSSTNRDLDNLLITSIQRGLNTAPTPAPREQEKDPETLFCLSLVQEFKDLPPKKRRLARLNILKVFCDMHSDDEE